jgi:hypothetical protein
VKTHLLWWCRRHRMTCVCSGRRELASHFWSAHVIVACVTMKSPVVTIMMQPSSYWYSDGPSVVRASVIASLGGVGVGHSGAVEIRIRISRVVEMMLASAWRQSRRHDWSGWSTDGRSTDDGFTFHPLITSTTHHQSNTNAATTKPRPPDSITDSRSTCVTRS